MQATMIRSIATVSLSVLLTSSAALAADARPAVAPPGRCAEPRSVADVRAEAYPVVGPIGSLFDPLDVAAGPPESGPRRPGPPAARAMVRPGACDQPGAGCGASPARVRVIEVPPVIPGVRPPGASTSVR